MTGYRASAAVARYSRVLAAEMYGEHRPYGYVYGGSGGAFKTIGCFENTADVWDGAVPFVGPTPMSMPYVFSVQAHAMRLLWDKFPDIVDAIEPGGGGDMYAGLTVEQREALAEVTRMGCPPRSWFDVERVARGYTGVWSVLADNVVRNDPTYFDDFWTVPGYLGHDAPESLRTPGCSTRRSSPRCSSVSGRPNSACRCRWRCRAGQRRTRSPPRCGWPNRRRDTSWDRRSRSPPARRRG